MVNIGLIHGFLTLCSSRTLKHLFESYGPFRVGRTNRLQYLVHMKLVCMCVDDHIITFNSSKTNAIWFKTNFLNLNFVPMISMYNATVEFVSKD